MGSPVAVAVVVGLAFLLVVLALYARNQRSAKAGEAGSAPPAERAPLDAATAEEARALVAAGRAIEAIKLVRDRSGLGLRESKEAVEALAAGAPPPPSLRPRTPPADAGPALEAEARALAASGNKLEAIKLVRERTGLGLRKAKEYVERLGP